MALFFFKTYKSDVLILFEVTLMRSKWNSESNMQCVRQFGINHYCCFAVYLNHDDSVNLNLHTLLAVVQLSANIEVCILYHRQTLPLKFSMIKIYCKLWNIFCKGF